MRRDARQQRQRIAFEDPTQPACCAYSGGMRSNKIGGETMSGKGSGSPFKRSDNGAAAQLPEET